MRIITTEFMQWNNFKVKFLPQYNLDKQLVDNKGARYPFPYSNWK